MNLSASKQLPSGEILRAVFAFYSLLLGPLFHMHYGLDLLPVQLMFFVLSFIALGSAVGLRLTPFL